VAIHRFPVVSNKLATNIPRTTADPRFHFGAQRGVTGACVEHKRRTMTGLVGERFVTILFDAPPAIRAHLVSSRTSHNFAIVQSRLTVLTDT
jgi:hypothetical protein